MKNYLIFIIALFMSGMLHAQSEECGTIPTTEELEYMEVTQAARTSFSQDPADGNVTQIPIVNHIVRRSNGTGGLAATQLTTAIQNLNTFYATASIEFVECEAVRFIDSDTWFDFNASQDFDIRSANNVVGSLNIYHFNTVTSSSGSNLCGYASFPSATPRDRIMMRSSCTTNGSTLIHEIGHFLSLFHTHGTSNCGTTDELVNGSNCGTAGDRVCDTPADPNLRYNPPADDCAAFWVGAGCTYTGTFTDPNGQQYTPQTDNIMSYSSTSCRSIFTAGQFQRAAFSATNERNYLSCAGGGGTCSSTVTTFPHTESFESAASLWSPISTSTTCSGEWARNSGGTGSADTGPSSANDGTFYLYTEASSCFNSIMLLESPCFDMSGLSNPEITFDYHMYGVNMGNLFLQVSTDQGDSWTTLQTISGQQQTSHAAAWTTETVSLSAYSGQTVKLRFRGAVDFGFTSDMAIDNIEVTGIQACTLSASPSTVNVDENAGSASFSVTSNSSWTVSDNAAWITLNTTSGTNNGTVSFNVTANTLTAQRTGTITVSCSGTSATVTVNQNGITPLGCQSPITSFPYSESFEAATSEWAPISTSTSCSGDWARDSGGTNSSSTGPATGSDGAFYLYTEASGCSNREMIVESPCFDLSGQSNLELTFDYHMYGSNMGNLFLEVSNDQGTSWAGLWTRSGQQQTSNAAAWITETISLSSYSNQTIILRFRGITGSSFRSDMAIDNIGLQDAQPTCTLSASPTTVSVDHNVNSASFSVTSNSSWTVTDNAAWITLNTTSGTNNGTVSFNVTANSAQTPRTGTITISCNGTSATVSVTQDGMPPNPTCQTVSTFPYTESFESTTSLWSPISTSTSCSGDWARDSGGTNSSSTGPATGSDGAFYLYTEASGCSNREMIVESPCFDLSGQSNLELTFDYHMYGSNMGDLFLEVSNDQGTSWTSLWTRSGQQQTSNAAAWITETISLNSYSNQTIILRFRGITGSSFRSDMAIDNIGLQDSQPTCTLSASPTTVNMNSAASSASFSVTSNSSWTVTDNAAWITLNTTSGANNGTVSFSVTANTATNQRTGVITVSCNGTSATVTVTQDSFIPPTCQTVSSFPYTESFEAATSLWAPISASTSCNGDWTRDASGTGSSGTGPSAASDGTYYLYTESSSSCSNTEMIVESPCFDLSGLSNPEVAFDYHKYGSNMGDLFLEVSTNQGSSWTTLQTIVGQQQTSNAAAWTTETVSLSAYSGQTIILRFRGITGSSFRSDMAIDNISISQPINCTPLVTSFPYTESFESATSLWAPISASTSCNGDWTRDASGTGSSGTGPSAANDGTYYLYTESSSTCSNTEMIVESPCFNLSGQGNLDFIFSYHMYGSTMGDLFVEISTDGGSSWTTAWTRSGQQHTSNGAAWSGGAFSLPTNQTVKLRFRGVTGTSFRSDMAIDYIRIEPSADKQAVDASIDTRNYPNPFSQQTTIEFDLPKDVPVTLFVSDMMGKRVAVILDAEQRHSGAHQVTFDGSAYPAGMYYYTIQAGEYTVTKKMILSK